MHCRGERNVPVRENAIVLEAQLYKQGLREHGDPRRLSLAPLNKCRPSGRFFHPVNPVSLTE